MMMTMMKYICTACQQVVMMDDHVFRLFAVLGFINPSLNPFIYAARYEVFKRSLKQMLGRDDGVSQASGGGQAPTTQFTRHT